MKWKWLIILICAPIGVFILLFLLVVITSYLPPAWLERCWQRSEIARRVQTAGGWDKIKQDCLTLAKQHPHGFDAYYRETKGLPPTIVALKPRRVEYDPKHARVRIWVFGIWRTGGPPEPYHIFEIPTAGKNLGERIGIGGEGFSDNFRWSRKPVVEGIDEIIGELVFR
ncbi:MAG: hypothetical protein HZC54_12475 [Verrucomicrobia bacterium]|nr:hypothetical protein [Verrucomicrobiota bacterium]